MPAAANDDRAIFDGKDRTLDNGDGYLSSFKAGFAVAKWNNFKTDNSVGHNDNYPDTDFFLFRVAEAYLTYAEATARLNGGITTKEGTDAVNALRDRAHAVKRSAYSLSDLCDEWSREFYYEGLRRPTLIRFGRFGGNNNYNWSYKGGAKAGRNFDAYRNIFAIPAAQVKGCHHAEPWLLIDHQPHRADRLPRSHARSVQQNKAINDEKYNQINRVAALLPRIPHGLRRRQGQQPHDTDADDFRPQYPVLRPGQCGSGHLGVARLQLVAARLRLPRPWLAIRSRFRPPTDGRRISRLARRMPPTKAVGDYKTFDTEFPLVKGSVAANEMAKALQEIVRYEPNNVPASQDVYVRVRAAYAGDTIYSNAVQIKVLPYYMKLKDAAIDVWYLIGGCIGDGALDQRQGCCRHLCHAALHRGGTGV